MKYVSTLARRKHLLVGVRRVSLARYRVAAALALALVPAPASAVLSVRDALRFDTSYRRADEVGLYDGPRLARVRQLLHAPAQVGYYSVPGRGSNLYLVQYALAPVIVVNDAAMPVVVADLPGPDVLPQTPAPFQYHLLADCGDGVRLYRTSVR